ncbi:MAG: signal peptidase II, partial [Alphaproteobacteria bacterium]|nr:signal peptidase II [Alphaproteobacteria bacterium]
AIDRLRFGRVVDFIDLHIGAWHWPAFNVADAAITIGAGLWAYSILFGQETNET